jgi:hypothetical protein
VEFQNSFKVYDFGFYLHNENMVGGYPEMFQAAITQLETQSPYYLLFGKQTDKTGIYTKFWFVLKMPTTAQFSCMTTLQREVYKKRVEVKTNEKYAANQNAYFTYQEAEIEGIQELIKIIAEIKDCCVANRNGVAERPEGCEGCSDNVASQFLQLQGFKKVNLNISTAAFANINTAKIKDYSFHKVTVGDQTDYLGEIMDSLVQEFNQWSSFNLLVTSYPSLCIDSISGSNLDAFKYKEDFNCQINFPSGDGLKPSDIKITWNKKAGACIQDQQNADRAIEKLYCQVYKELNIQNNTCNDFGGTPAPPWVFNFKTGQPSGGLTITQFIQLVKDEEEKYTPEERVDTKTMITRFRKVFYGSPGWDEKLITGASSTPCIKPYKILSSENSSKTIPVSPVNSFVMIDRGFYPVDPTNNNQRPEINKITNGSPQTQEVRLESGNHSGMLIDIGHTLCGMDAYNFPNNIEALPVLSVDINRNLDAVTWLGDIGSALAEIRVQSFMYGRGLTPIEIQDLIDHYASAPDMLGDIDGIVIGLCYSNGANPSLKTVSSILEHYYFGDGVAQFQNKRYTLFAQNLGLEWDSGQHKFTNRTQWIKNWEDQVNDTAAIYIGAAAKEDGMMNTVCAIITIFSVSMSGFSDQLLEPFVNELENLRKLEP